MADLTEERLAELLREAEAAHAEYEQTLGQPGRRLAGLVRALHRRQAGRG